MGRGDPRGGGARGWIRGAEGGGGDGKEGVCAREAGARDGEGGGAPARCRGRRGEVRLGVGKRGRRGVGGA